MAERQFRSDTHFNGLVSAHRCRFLDSAIRLVGGDVAWAEDIVQETFVRAWRALDGLTQNQGSVHGSLRRVAHNISVDEHLRRRSRSAEVELEDLNVAVRDDHSDDVLRDIMVEQAPVGTVKSRLQCAPRALQDSVLSDGLRAS